MFVAILGVAGGIAQLTGFNLRDLWGSPPPASQVMPAKTDWPAVNLDYPLEDQLQVFPTDQITLVAAPQGIRTVDFGFGPQEFVEGKKYTAVGVPGKPITPKIDGGEGLCKLEIVITNDRDKPRGLLGRPPQ
jgi:hypothetical protein